jgi:hypothetical protein
MFLHNVPSLSLGPIGKRKAMFLKGLKIKGLGMKLVEYSLYNFSL